MAATYCGRPHGASHTEGVENILVPVEFDKRDWSTVLIYLGSDLLQLENRRREVEAEWANRQDHHGMDKNVQLYCSFIDELKRIIEAIKHQVNLQAEQEAGG